MAVPLPKLYGGLLSRVDMGPRDGRQNNRLDICRISGEPATRQLQDRPHLYQFHFHRSDTFLLIDNS